MKSKELEIALTTYIALKHNQDGCIGFIDGYTQCQEDMANESIKFAEWINKNDYEKIHGDRWCKKFMSYTHSTVELFEIFIKSLNKQD